MGDEKVIAVVGATGAQGGALVRAILRGTDFVARALTRDPGAPKARLLADAGAEVVAADLDDQASVRRAFSGAFGAFCVTNYWEHHSPERELAQAWAMAAAARHADLQHVVWSTLEDTRRWMKLDDSRMPTIKGKYKVPHFDGKGEANQLFVDAGAPTTFLLTSFYWDNLIHFGMGPRRGADGRLSMTFPMGDKKLPGIAVDDIGRSAYAIFVRGAEFRGKTIGIAGEHLTGAEMADQLTHALGEDVRYHDVSLDAYRNLAIPGAADLANMFQFKCDFQEEFCAARDVALTRQLNPELRTFAQWLAQNKTRIPRD
ncbi:MAG: NmrA/HSCARG family protein [Acidobacteriota bacterium]